MFGNSFNSSCSQIDDTLSVYLEYVSGGSIHKLLQEYGSFKEPVIQNYTRQIVSGLAYLHGRNTVHRWVVNMWLLLQNVVKSVRIVLLTCLCQWQGHQRGKHFSRNYW